MDDNLAQEEEINALKSIYQENDIFLIDESKNSGVFYVKLETEQFYTLNFSKYYSDFNCLVKNHLLFFI
jgi:hypothetical protein